MGAKFELFLEKRRGGYAGDLFLRIIYPEKPCYSSQRSWNCGTVGKTTMVQGRRWSERDRYGNDIYLSDERWEHITESANHPEMLTYEGELRETIRSGRRKQDALNPQKYRYMKSFDSLAEFNTHIVAIVLFRFTEDENGTPAPNNYIVTAYQKEIG